jgi:NAD(P)H-hydrate epimerase
MRVNGRDTNKGTFGHVAIFAGSNGFSGAPVLVAEGAARTGAGLVTLAVPESIQQAVMSHVSPVVMTRGLNQAGQGSLCLEALESALRLANQVKAAALGPGIGHGDNVAAFTRSFIEQCQVPLVLDADAINLLASEPDRGALLIRGRGHPTVLTPHPAEMGRLLGITTKAVEEDRRSAVTTAAKNYECVVLLKGARTLIASPDGTLYLNTTGNPGMATGGTGDVLTGVIVALLAQGLEPLRAAVAGGYLHGMAGDLASSIQGGTTGIIATDLIAHLPQSIAVCQNCGINAQSASSAHLPNEGNLPLSPHHRQFLPQSEPIAEQRMNSESGNKAS